jgi:hypothetical protein
MNTKRHTQALKSADPDQSQATPELHTVENETILNHSRYTYTGIQR